MTRSGNRTAVIDPINGASHPTSFAYDAMSRLTGITYPDGSTVGFGYDIRGRRVTATDQNNEATTYAYDDADRLTAVTDPAHNTTQYAYDTEDNLLSITDANNHITQFAYNARGWVTQTTFPSTLMESYTYDLVGNLQSKTDRRVAQASGFFLPVPEPWVPRPCVRCKGGRRCCLYYFVGHATRLASNLWHPSPHHLHFTTCLCYRRLPFLRAACTRDRFLSILEETRQRYSFVVLGYVVMWR